MKKLIALLTLFLAFSVTVVAQNKKSTTKQTVKISSQEAAQKDINALTAKVKISDNLQKDLLTLMTMKHDAISDATLTNEQKEAALKGYEHKLMSGLTEEQRKELFKYPDLVKQLTH